METDEDLNPEPGQAWPEEDLSVYVAPKAAPPAPSSEPILRLEPNLALVSFPLAILFFVDVGLYFRLEADRHVAVYTLDRIAFLLLFVVTTLVVASPFYFSPTYFAELYGDRLVVRRGAKEWATPLEDIVKVDLLPCPVAGASDLLLLRLLASFGAAGRFSSLSPMAGFASDAPRPRSSVLHAYLVRTAFDTDFWIPPFAGHEEFATAVLQQREHILAHRPPIVRGTVHENL